jgi:hypothetical protein
MLQKIVQAKGGLHNRLTRQIRLLSFTLGESEVFLESRGAHLTLLQIVELYVVMGGIPHYLKQAEPGLSAAQIIDNTYFSSQGLLREEFKKLYVSLFDEYSLFYLDWISKLEKRSPGDGYWLSQQNSPRRRA